MAYYYVYHGSLQDDSDATWNSSTLAYLDLSLAIAGSVTIGDTIYVDSTH